MNNTLYYWLAFLLYSFTVIVIGFSVWSKEKKSKSDFDTNEFWSANKTLSGWSVGLSISASMMSISWSCVYGVQLFYWYGTGGAWLLIIPWLFTMAGFYFLVPLFRKNDVFSQPELLEKRFGRKSRILLAPALIVVFITWTGAEIFAAGNIIAPFLGISAQLTFFLIALVVAIYSYTGGFKAVVSTDKIQFVLVAFFITVIAILGFRELPADLDLSSLKPTKMAGGKMYFSPGIVLIIITFFAYLPGWLIETDLWVRIQAAHSHAAAKRGVLIAGINSLLFVGIMPLIIGLSALYLFPPVDGQAPQILQDGALIFTVFMQSYAPTWLSLFLSLGLIAAAMSTIDTCGNIVALSFSRDLVEPQIENRTTPAQRQILARVTSVGAIFIAFVYALFTDSLWDIFYLSSGILTTTVFIPVIASFFKNVTSLQVNTSIVVGFISTIIFYFLESQNLLENVQLLTITKTGLGYILWSFFTSLSTFIFMKFFGEK